MGRNEERDLDKCVTCSCVGVGGKWWGEGY